MAVEDFLEGLEGLQIEELEEDEVKAGLHLLVRKGLQNSILAREFVQIVDSMNERDPDEEEDEEEEEEDVAQPQNRERRVREDEEESTERF